MTSTQPPFSHLTSGALGAAVRWTVALGVALIVGCGSGTTVPGQTTDDVRELYPDIPAAAVDLGAQPMAAVSTPLSQIPDRRRMVLKTAGEWAAYWALFYGNISPTPQPVAVTFDSEMVIVATSGTRPTGGYMIQIEGIFEADDEVLVAVLETSPGAGCMTTQAVSAPAAAVRVAGSPHPVRFVERHEEVPC